MLAVYRSRATARTELATARPSISGRSCPYPQILRTRCWLESAPHCAARDFSWSWVCSGPTARVLICMKSISCFELGTPAVVCRFRGRSGCVAHSSIQHRLKIESCRYSELLNTLRAPQRQPSHRCKGTFIEYTSTTGAGASAL